MTVDAAPTRTSRWPRWLTRERRRMTWRFLIALVVLVFFLFPVYWLFITSIKSAGDIFARPPVWFPNEPNFRIFGILFKDGDVWAIYNSLIIASVSTVVAMVAGHRGCLQPRALQDRRPEPRDLDHLAADDPRRSSSSSRSSCCSSGSAGSTATSG